MTGKNTYSSVEQLFLTHKVLQPTPRQTEVVGAEFGRGEALGERLAQEVVNRFRESLRETPKRQKKGTKGTA